MAIKNRFKDLHDTIPSLSFDNFALELISKKCIKDYDSNNFRSLGTQISRIEKLDFNEIQSTRSINVNLLLAYSRYFNVSTDWLLFKSDVKTKDENIKMICRYTGLSEEAVERISKYDNNKKEILNSLICDDNSYDLLYLLLTSLYLYGINVNNADITIRDRSLDTTTQITDNETIKRMLKYDTAESFDFCLNHVAKMYRPVIEENLKRTIELKEKETMLQLIKDGYSPKEARAKLDEIKKGSDTK